MYEHNYQEFNRRISQLAERTHIWPSLDLIKMTACRWNTLQKVDRIAQNITKTLRPSTRLWDGRRIPSDKVLRRCYSAYQEEVYQRDGLGSRIPTVDALRLASRSPGRHWMAQDWIYTLRQLGE